MSEFFNSFISSDSLVDEILDEKHTIIKKINDWEAHPAFKESEEALVARDETQVVKHTNRSFNSFKPLEL